MLKAFYDESGTHDGSPVTVLAGFVGDPDECAHFDTEWNKVLRNFGVPFAHAERLHRRKGLYKGWTLKQARQLRNDLIYVIQEHKRLSITKTILRNEDYNNNYRLAPAARRERLDTKYALCVRACLHFIARAAHNQANNNVANFLLEDGHGHSGDARRVWEETRNEKRLPWHRSVGSLSFGGKAGNPLLQAADLIAHSVYRDELAIERGDENIFVSNNADEVYPICSLEDELASSGLIIANHFITFDDMRKLRNNHLVHRANSNIFKTTEAYFDANRYIGWKDEKPDFRLVGYGLSENEFLLLRRQIPPRSMTRHGI